MAKKATAFKDRDALTLEGLKEEFGDEDGARLYAEAARAGGFFDPDHDKTGNRPPLDLKGLRRAASDTHPGAVANRKVAHEALARVEAVFTEPAPPPAQPKGKE